MAAQNHALILSKSTISTEEKQDRKKLISPLQYATLTGRGNITNIFFKYLSNGLEGENLEQLYEVLLKLTAKGDKIKAEAMIKFEGNHIFILQKSTFTEDECGQREWKKPISPLQYAAWVGDTRMIDMYLRIYTYKTTRRTLTIQKPEHGTEHGPFLFAITDLISAYKIP